MFVKWIKFYNSAKKVWDLLSICLFEVKKNIYIGKNEVIALKRLMGLIKLNSINHWFCLFN